MKKEIIEKLIGKVKAELASLEEVSQAAVDYAQSGDLKSDGKYDTRGIEAGYLASAQQKRVEELKLEIQMLEEIPLRDFGPTDEVVVGALIDLIYRNNLKKYFLCTTAGGTIINVGDHSVLVISVFSPIGDAVLGQKIGDEFELDTPSETRVYRVAGIS